MRLDKFFCTFDSNIWEVLFPHPKDLWHYCYGAQAEIQCSPHTACVSGLTWNLT